MRGDLSDAGRSRLYFKKWVFTLIMLIFWLPGCLSESEGVTGFLIYDNGKQSIHLMDLKNRAIKEIYKHPRDSLENVTYGRNKNTIIFGKSDGWHYVRTTLIEYSLLDGKIRELGRGMSPVYMRNHDKLFYYYRPEKDRPVQLKMADGYAVENPETVRTIHESVRLSYEQVGFSAPVVPVSEDAVVYSQGEDNVFKYNIVEDKNEKLNITNCSPRAWRSKTGTLICAKKWREDDSPEQFYEIGLDGKDKRYFPNLGEAVHINYGPLYLERIDALLFTLEPKFPTLMIYSIGKETLKSFAKGSITSGILLDLDLSLYFK